MSTESKRKRVLVVDDEDVLLTMMDRLLRKAGYEVLLAGSAQAALEILEAQADVDLLLTDVRMPGITGPQLAARLTRRDPPAIVFMSGAAEETPEALVGLGGRGFIKKPFRITELLEVLRNAMQA